MVTLIEIDLKDAYYTETDNLVEDFYKPCLSSAVTYDRSVAFFRSAVFTLAPEQIAQFAQRGGRMRLVCSPALNEEDIQAAWDGYQRREHLVESALLLEIEALLASVRSRAATELLATLISVGALEIRVAFRPRQGSIYHEKIGLFADSEGNRVSFKGSANESWTAWCELGNYESFDVFRSWRSDDGPRVEAHRKHFELLWMDRAPGIQVMDFPVAARKRLLDVAKDRVENWVMDVSSDSTRRTLLPHQIAVIEDWYARDRRGIIKHATGAGKTVAALSAVRAHVSQGLTALIVVPSRILLDQWSDDVKREIPEASLMLIGAGFDHWRRTGSVEAFFSSRPGLGPRVAIGTLQSISRPTFLSRLSGGNHLLLVIDEVHRAGSPEHRRALGISAGSYLGLSATPTRFGDPDGTAAIMSTFRQILSPEVTVEDAIRLGRLVPYKYFIHPIQLSDDESARWSRLTREINAALAQLGLNSSDGKSWSDFPDSLKFLILKRSKIVKKASAKVSAAVDIVYAHYREGASWIVYCEDRQQLSEVQDALRVLGLEVLSYYAEMEGDREGTLQWFRSYGGILVAIRCLDEGVDIPSISDGLILASSKNSREFIQRRGRLLRVSDGKRSATVHDVVVVPSLQESDQMAIVLESELSRAQVFAQAASNPEVRIEIERLLAQAGLSVSGPHDEEDE